MAFRVHPDNPTLSPYVRILNLITSAKTVFGVTAFLDRSEQDVAVSLEGTVQPPKPITVSKQPVIFVRSWPSSTLPTLLTPPRLTLPFLFVHNIYL